MKKTGTSQNPIADASSPVSGQVRLINQTDFICDEALFAPVQSYYQLTSLTFTIVLQIGYQEIAELCKNSLQFSKELVNCYNIQKKSTHAMTVLTFYSQIPLFKELNTETLSYLYGELIETRFWPRDKIFSRSNLVDDSTIYVIENGLVGIFILLDAEFSQPTGTRNQNLELCLDELIDLKVSEGAGLQKIAGNNFLKIDTLKEGDYFGFSPKYCQALQTYKYDSLIYLVPETACQVSVLNNGTLHKIEQFLASRDQSIKPKLSQINHFLPSDAIIDVIKLIEQAVEKYKIQLPKIGGAHSSSNHQIVTGIKSQIYDMESTLARSQQELMKLKKYLIQAETEDVR